MKIKADRLQTFLFFLATIASALLIYFGQVWTAVVLTTISLMICTAEEVKREKVQLSLVRKDTKQ